MITVYVEFPKGYDVAGIDASNVPFNGVVPAATDTKYDFVTKNTNIFRLERKQDY